MEFSRYDEKIILFSYFNRKESSLFRRFVKSMCCRYRINGTLEGIVFFNSSKRQDYVPLFDKIKNSCEKRNDIDIKRVLLPNFFSLISFLKHLHNLDGVQSVLQKYKVEGWEAELSTRSKLSILLDLIIHWQIVKDISRYNWSNVKASVVLCDTFFYESALQETCNGKNVLTVTCQHGVYPREKIIKSVHQLNYVLVPSKIALLWGKGMEELFKSNNEACQCIICGNPMIIRENFDIEGGYVGVNGDIPEYQEYNQKLIDVAEKYALERDKKVHIRLHPVDNVDNYEINKKVTICNNDLDSADFILAHTSTMIFTYMAKGKKVLILNCGMQNWIEEETVLFSDLNDLVNKVENLNTIEYSKLVEKQYKYAGSEAEKKYKDFFANLE